MTIDPWLSVSLKEIQSVFFQQKGGDMICACSVLDLILIHLVLHVKDMSFDKQQQNTHHRLIP